MAGFPSELDTKFQMRGLLLNQAYVEQETDIFRAPYVTAKNTF